MDRLSVGKVSVALAYTNTGVLGLLRKTQRAWFSSPEMHLKSRVSLTNCITKLLFRKISVWHLQGSVPSDSRGILTWGQRQRVRAAATGDGCAFKVSRLQGQPPLPPAQTRSQALMLCLAPLKVTFR